MPSYFQDSIEFLVLSWQLGALLANHQALGHSTPSCLLGVHQATQNLLAMQCILAAFNHLTTRRSSSAPVASSPIGAIVGLSALLAVHPVSQIWRTSLNKKKTRTVVSSLNGSQAVAYRAYKHSGYALPVGFATPKQSGVKKLA